MSKNTTSYTLTVAGEPTDFVRSTKATVVAEAEKTRKAGQKGAICVVTQTGFVAFELKAVKQRLITKTTKPFTKVVELPTELAARVPDGYVAAYARLRQNAIVLRNEDADEESRYAVMQALTGDIVDYAATTREAGQIMKGMKVVALAE